MGRQAKGVRLIKLEPDQLLSTMVAFEESHDEDILQPVAHVGGGMISSSAAADNSSDFEAAQSDDQRSEVVEAGEMQHSLFSMDLDDMPRTRTYGSDDEYKF
jgi:hypothetical protein